MLLATGEVIVTEAAWDLAVVRIGADRKLQAMILNSTVCPTAAVAGNLTGAACNTTGLNSAIVGQDPGFGPTGQEEIPDFGVSDVAPFMFKGAGIGTNINVEYGANELASTTHLSIKPVNTLMMGIVTTASADIGNWETHRCSYEHIEREERREKALGLERGKC